MPKALVVLCCSLMLVGCGGGESEVKKNKTASPTKSLTKTEQLHNKAKVAEAAGIVGYDGKQIREDLDKIIDQNAEHQKMLEDINDM
jgi:outer membrane murein-binding lipoprotein Lpp